MGSNGGSDPASKSWSYAKLLGLDVSEVDRGAVPQPAAHPAVKSATRPPMTRAELVGHDEDLALLTAGEVAAILRIHENTLFLMIRRGEFQGGVKVGGRWRFTHVDEYLRTRKQQRGKMIRR